MSPKRVSDLAPSNITRVICTEQYSRWVGAKVGDGPHSGRSGRETNDLEASLLKVTSTNPTHFGALSSNRKRRPLCWRCEPASGFLQVPS